MRSVVHNVFRHPRVLLRVIASVLLVDLIALALGIAFLFIVHGLIFTLFFLARYWSPAYGVLTRLLGRHENAQVFTPLPITWWRIPLLIVNVGMRLALIVIGLWVLYSGGFWGQNLIYILAR